MAIKTINDSSLSNIASAIRAKLGVNTTYTPSQMAAAIASIPGASTLGTKSVTANGTYAASSDSLDGYSSVSVNVANSYGSSDEGKVVSSGALVAQTARSDAITVNGTYNTTTNNSVTVNVSGGGSSVIVGECDPDDEVGNVGSIYVKVQYPPSAYEETATRTYTLVIVNALRGSDALSYAGACEIAFIFDDGQGNEVNIRTLSGFTYASNRGGTISYAFDGQVNGNYWEASPTPITVTMSATVPAGYTPKKLSVVQRSASYTSDVWKTFTLTDTTGGGSVLLISKSNLSTSDWAGAYNYTDFDMNGTTVISTYIKTGQTEEEAEWTETDKIDVTIVDAE